MLAKYFRDRRVVDRLLGSALGAVLDPLAAHLEARGVLAVRGESIAAPGLPGTRNDGGVFNGTRDDLMPYGQSSA
jgi:hypothetical protein